MSARPNHPPASPASDAPALDVPVLVVGGGPAGLATALLLARWGVRALLVERRAGPSTHPKATGISTRTMELLRQWGLEDAVRARALDVEFFASAAATLAAPEVGRRPLGYPDPEAARAVSPTAPAALAQDELEPLLVARARACGAELRFGCELVALRPRGRGAHATLRDRATGATTRVRARYVVAADGARSPVRRAAGIALGGAAEMGAYLSVLFRADLAPLLGARRCALYTVLAGGPADGLPGAPRGGPPSVVVPTRRDGTRWVLALPWPAERAAPDAAELAALVRRAAGAPDLAVEVLGARPAVLGAAVAERFRLGPVFLVGDAAHRMTPTGGMGLNTAVHDAHNLAWKLAAVLQGWAGPALLDTYEAERRPVAERNVARSLGRLPEVSGVAADLGIAYAAADPESGRVLPAAAHDGVLRAARVGGRAPHVWLAGADRLVSPLDLADERFVLLAGADGVAWVAAAARAAAAAGVPLAAYGVGGAGTLADVSGGDWRAAYGVGPAGAVLLRPDGHVAWVARGAAADPAAALDGVLRALLDRPMPNEPPRAARRAPAARGAPPAAAAGAP